MLMRAVPLKRWVALVVIAGVLTLTVLASMGRAGAVFSLAAYLPGEDAAGHFLVMGLLSAAVNFGFAGARVGRVRLGVISLTAVVLVAISLEELSQGYIPGRRVTFSDWGAGCAGTVLAALAVAPFVRGRRNDGSGYRSSA
jgi:VanZ family protein